MTNKTFTAALIMSLVALLYGCGQPNQPPTVSITEPTNNSRMTDLTVTFKAESSDDGEIANSVWYFNDGDLSQEGGNEITHTFEKAGQYTVRYTVTDDKDESTSKTVTITINEPPLAAARAQVVGNDDAAPFIKSVEGYAPLEVQFQGNASRDDDGDLASYAWDFGDGNTSADIDPAHTYAEVGDYEATLTVTDNEGTSTTDKILVSINAEPIDITDLVTPEGDAELQPYALIKGSTIGTNSVNKTVLYSYRLNGEGPYSEEEIRLALLDIVLSHAQTPDISHTTVYLFTETKQGFLEPVDYDHYLGIAVWERPVGQISEEDLGNHVLANTILNYNATYLSGEALGVLGYTLIQSHVAADDPRCSEVCADTNMTYTVIIFNPWDEEDAANGVPEPAPMCKEEVDRTIQAVLQRGLMAPGVYGLNVFEHVFDPTAGKVAGLWSPTRNVDDVRTDSALLFDIFPNEPESWDIDSDNFKLRYTVELPACEPSTTPITDASGDSSESTFAESGS
jgi:PKD repeat protein